MNDEQLELFPLDEPHQHMRAAIQRWIKRCRGDRLAQLLEIATGQLLEKLSQTVAAECGETEN